MAKLKIAKTITELETKYKVKKGKAKRYAVDKENLPDEFWVLIPYLNYFAIKAQDVRNDFCEDLPKKAFEDLNAVISTIRSDLTHWLVGEEADKIPLSSEYVALTVLNEIADNNFVYPASPKLTDIQKARVEYLLKLDKKELIKVWNIPLDEYNRIDFDVDKLPDNLKPLKAILNVVSLEDEDDLEAYTKQFPPFVKDDMKMIKLYFNDEIKGYCLQSGIETWESPLSNEVLAVDMLRILHV